MSLIDTQEIKKSSDYEEVLESYMIFICEGDYQDEDTVLGRLIHDFHCIDPNEMYSEVFKKWVKYYKEERKGVIEMCEI